MSKKPQITFESENDLRDTIKATIDNIIKEGSKIPKIHEFIEQMAPVVKFSDELYRKNMKLLGFLQEMNSQIVVIAAKIQMIQKTTDSEQSSLKQLKKEFDDASNRIEIATSGEEKAKGIVKKMRETIDDLSSRILNGEAMTMGSGVSVMEMQRDISKINKEKNNYANEFNMMTSKLKFSKGSLEKARSNNEILNKQFDRMNRNIKEAEDLGVSLSNEIQTLFKELDEANPKIQELNDQISDISKTKQEKSKELGNLKKETEQLNTTVSSIQEELKSKQLKRNHKNRVISDIKENQLSLTSRIEEVNEKLQKCDEELTYLNQLLNNTNEQNQALTEENSQLTSKFKDIGNNKKEFRKKARETYAQIPQKKLQLIQDNATIKTDKKKISNSKQDLKKEQELHILEKMETNVASEAAKGLLATMTTEKHELQRLKESALSLMKDIEEAKTNKFQSQRLTNSAVEKNNEINEENKQQMKELAIINSRCEHQVSMADSLRIERGVIKRKLEEIEGENHELQLNNDELNSTLQELKQKYEETLFKTAKDHITLRNIKADIKNIKFNNKRVKEMSLLSQDAAARIQTESKTLKFILQNAQNDHIQQRKELQFLQQSIEKIREHILKKEKQIKDLREEIKASQYYLQKSSTLFNEKTKEIAQSQNEISALTTKSVKLEAKKNKMNYLESEMFALQTNLMIEKHKHAALMHEFSIPRIVHRWNLLLAFDPETYRQIQYKTDICAKIGTAHQKLMALKEEKAILEKKLEKMKANAGKALTRQKVQSDIDMYKADIKRMNKEMKEIEEKIIKNKPRLTRKSETVTSVRSKVIERRELAGSIKNEIYDLKSTLAPEPWFITEAPIIRPVVQGGGFSMMLPENSAHKIRNSAPSHLAIGSRSIKPRPILNPPPYQPRSRSTVKSLQYGWRQNLS